MRDDGRVPGVARRPDRLERLGERPDLVHLDQDRVGDAALDPLAEPLAQIVDYVYGPRAVIAEEFGRIPGLSRLLIFGSWAARHTGSTGPAPHDVDVLVVGSAERGAVYAAADRVQDRIGMPVNPVLSSQRRWDADADALILQVKSGPVIDLTNEARQPQPGEATA